jgi:hypothetical protein
LTGLTSSASADSLEPVLQAKTVQAFTRYATAVETRNERELRENFPFLDIERQSAAQQARTIAALKRGEIVVTRAAARDGSSSEVAIDEGLINHWRATVLVPRVTLDAVLKTLQAPGVVQHKQEDVVSARVDPRGPGAQHLFVRVRRTKFVTVVYDTEYDVTYQQLAADRAVSISRSTRIVEIENPGTPRERALPEGQDHGYMWRLNSYWRYRQTADGVLVEVESLTLSRSLPAIVGGLVRPIVSGTARESMERTLSALRARFP